MSAAAIPPGPGLHEFVKCSVSAEGSSLRVLLVARDPSGRKLHAWQLVPREASREALEREIAELWRRMEEA